MYYNTYKSKCCITYLCVYTHTHIYIYNIMSTYLSRTQDRAKIPQHLPQPQNPKKQQQYFFRHQALSIWNMMTEPAAQVSDLNFQQPVFEYVPCIYIRPTVLVGRFKPS